MENRSLHGYVPLCLALTGFEHDVFVGIWLRVLVILATERIERFLLVINGKVIHSETERIVAQVYATTLTFK